MAISAPPGKGRARGSVCARVCVCVRVCERERERRRAEPGGERARARERACVRQRARSLSAPQAAPRLSRQRGVARLGQKVFSASQGSVAAGGGSAMPCWEGTEIPLPGAFQSGLGLALAASPAGGLEGEEGCDWPP